MFFRRRIRRIYSYRAHTCHSAFLYYSQNFHIQSPPTPDILTITIFFKLCICVYAIFANVRVLLKNLLADQGKERSTWLKWSLRFIENNPETPYISYAYLSLGTSYVVLHKAIHFHPYNGTGTVTLK